MSPSLLRFVCLSVCVCACNASQNTGDDDEGPPPDATAGDGPRGDAPPTTIVPRAGTWTYADTPVSNTCPANTPVGEAGTFVIDQVTASSFRIVPGDGTAPFSCNLSGAAFDCPERASRTEDLTGSGIDAVIAVRARASGTFASSTHGTGDQSATATCSGTQCGVLGANTFPCSASVTFVIDAL